jgi:hypothetical protein|tara:strand:+ start:170 stop:670 length:501 start_codon:yes stop_codon:yes gene_type:complete
MIEIKITEQMKKRAWRKARQMGEINNSITKGDGNIAGFLGEEIANELIKGDINNTYDYDIIKSGVTYDVKTKRCTSKPKPYYECSVAAFNTKQKCNYYVFVRIENIKGKWTRAWVLGVYDKGQYFKEARFLKKGQTDGDNNFRVKANCYNMRIDKLQEVEIACPPS